MRFGIVRPPTHAALEDHPDLRAAERAAGLEGLDVDHGVVIRGLCIVVWELGLLADPATTRYFSILGQLYAGGAVLYATDERGETADLRVMPPVAFYPSAAAAERAIEAGAVARPGMAVNGVSCWHWPP